MENPKAKREFLRASNWENFSQIQTDQQQRRPAPPLQRALPEALPEIDLPPVADLQLGQEPLAAIIAQRRSRRKFADAPLSLEALSYLLWATQGLREIIANGKATFRTVPSAGARHPLNTYLSVRDVTGLDAGLYYYQPLEHRLRLLRPARDTETADLVAGCNGQSWVAGAAVTFIWTAVPYRTEWRYHVLAHKFIALDAGHVCQNLYLAAESIGAGTCGIAAYDQARMDALLDIDGEDEFTLYIAPVGMLPTAS